MLRLIARALSACASIAAIALLAPAASAQFLPMHPVIGGAGPDQSDVGSDPDNPIEPGFGWALVIRNEHAFIGMPFGSPVGRVGVFTATSTDLLRTATLTAADPVPGEQFGRVLAFRDGILVVGALNAAYIFQRSNGVWTQRQKITAPAADNVGSFADVLHYADGTLAITANTNNVNDVPGAVYIYQRDAAGRFVVRGKLASSDSRPHDAFGSSISTAGPVMVVGAPGLGRAYVFRRTSTGAWREHQTLLASELGTGGAGFGATAAIDRGMIVVGAPGFSIDGDPFEPQGAAYGFVLSNGVYVETFKLEPGPTQIDCCAFFGRQVAMFDQRIVVGAQQSVSSDRQLNGFGIFTYTRAGSSVLPRGIVGGDPFSSNFASTSLSLANQRLLVGIPCTSSFPSFCPGSGKAELYNLNILE
jgi:hypothetical protein